MPKAFISVLGTNNYLECYHRFPDGSESKEPVKYVQEDLIKKYCSNWTENDEIRIFLTKDAKEKNWEDNGHLDRDGKKITNAGLLSRLKKISVRSKIIPISINEGFNENEIWYVFQTIFDTFRNEEEVIVDITHSFRSLPLLMVTLLNFAKQVKKIKILGIYYAAFENLGPINIVSKIPIDERIAPVLDLTSFSDLQDWTNATFDFIHNANLAGMKSLVKSSLNDENSLNNKEKFFPVKVIDNLNLLVDDIALCRGNELLKFNYNEIRSYIASLKDRNLPKAFYYLMDEIQSKIENFNNNPVNLALTVSEWCVNHKLFQQAITLLQEFSITIILEQYSLDISNRDYRELVSQTIRIFSEKIPEENWYKPAKDNLALVKQLLKSNLLKALSSEYSSLSEIRNDVNHAGFLETARNINSIKNKLKNITERYKEILNQYAHQPLKSSE